MAEEFGKYICILLTNHNLKIKSSKNTIMGLPSKKIARYKKY